jgi:hypothetical protein
MAVITASALLGSAALGGPSYAADGGDVASALAEVKAAAVTTRAAAADGFVSHGFLENSGGPGTDLVYDGKGHTRATSSGGDPRMVAYTSTGVGVWTTMSAENLETYGPALAYIGRSDVKYEYYAAPAHRADWSEAADLAEDLGERSFTFLSVDKSGDSPANTTYAFTGYIEVPTQLTTMTVELTEGALTRFNWFTAVANDDDLEYERTWTYEPQELIVVPSAAESMTLMELLTARSALLLKSTVRAHAREVGVTAKKIAKKAKRKKVTVADVRVAANRVVRYYQETQGQWRDVLPTASVNLTGGVALHATDPFKNKVRIATVQAVKGKVVVSL